MMTCVHNQKKATEICVNYLKLTIVSMVVSCSHKYKYVSGTHRYHYFHLDFYAKAK